MDQSHLFRACCTNGKKLIQDAQKAGVKEADKVLENITKLEAKK